MKTPNQKLAHRDIMFQKLIYNPFWKCQNSIPACNTHCRYRNLKTNYIIRSPADRILAEVYGSAGLI
jgi:hypothetical protein